MKGTLKSLLAAGLLAAPAFAKDVITYEAKTAYPEGIAYDAKGGRFLVSSMRLGSIGAVTRDGRYSAFIEDDALISSVGMTVDVKRNRLLVCVSDPGVGVKSADATKGKLARLVAFDLATRKRLSVIDLGALVPGGHFANDLALDDQGNVYVTDSFSPVIYKVDAAGVPSVFLQDESLRGEGFNLNGIVFHPKGYLLVARYNAGVLYKVALSSPTLAPVAVKESFSGADGLLLDEKNDLVLVQNNGANKVFKLSSRDGWKTAAVVAAADNAFDFPTTAVRVGSSVYVNNVHLGELFDPKNPKERTRFSIEEARFKTR